MRKSIFLFLAFSVLINITGQKKNSNALIFPNLVISDVVPLDADYFNGYGYASSFYSQAVIKTKLSKKLNLSALMVKKMTNHGFTVYEDFSPYKNAYLDRYDELFIKADMEKILKDLGGKSDTLVLIDKNGKDKKSVVNQPIDTSQLQALLFFDKWFFDKEKFQLTKTVLGYCPVRKYQAPSDDFGEDKWFYRKTEWFVFPELKKGKLKRLGKRMKFLGHFQYEFSIENKTLFGKDDENALYLEELDAPNWNSFARQIFRNLLINRALSGKSKVVDYYTNNALNLDEIKENLGYGVQKVVVIDPETGQEKEIEMETNIYKEDIKSLIFFEDWYIDTKTMRIKKYVKAIAPVRFYPTEGDEWKKKIAFTIFFD